MSQLGGVVAYNILIIATNKHSYIKHGLSICMKYQR